MYHVSHNAKLNKLIDELLNGMDEKGSNVKLKVGGGLGAIAHVILASITIICLYFDGSEIAKIRKLEEERVAAELAKIALDLLNEKNINIGRDEVMLIFLILFSNRRRLFGIINYVFNTVTRRKQLDDIKKELGKSYPVMKLLKDKSTQVSEPFTTDGFITAVNEIEHDYVNYHDTYGNRTPEYKGINPMHADLHQIYDQKSQNYEATNPLLDVDYDLDDFKIMRNFTKHGSTTRRVTPTLRKDKLKRRTRSMTAEHLSDYNRTVRKPRMRTDMTENMQKRAALKKAIEEMKTNKLFSKNKLLYAGKNSRTKRRR